MRAYHKIVAVAIRDTDGTIYTLPQPARHHHVIRMMVEEHNRPTPIIGEQGFLDESGRFLNRKQALYTANKNNQVIEKHPPVNLLLSEDVW